MKTIKAGFVEAPCTLVKVPGRTMLETVMKVARIERDDNKTTFIGRFSFPGTKGNKVIVENGVYV
ncbi:MAG: hypothetical protein EPO08_21030, partial [Rhodospirillaceae bacterium]